MVVRFDTSLSIIFPLLSVRSWGEERSEERSECRSLMTDYISLTPGGKLKKRETEDDIRYLRQKDSQQRKEQEAVGGGSKKRNHDLSHRPLRPWGEMISMYDCR